MADENTGCDCKKIVFLGDQATIDQFTTTKTDNCGNEVCIVDLRNISSFQSLKDELTADPAKALDLFANCILANLDKTTRVALIKQIFDTTTNNSMYANTNNGCRVGEQDGLVGTPGFDPIANL